MLLSRLFSALVVAASARPVLSLITVPDLYADALKGEIKGKPREYSPHEWALKSKCQQVRLIGHGRVGQTAIQGVCVDDKGARWLSELDLNKCFANLFGKLIYTIIEPEPFDRSCSHCRLFHAKLEGELLMACACRDQNSEPQPAVVRLGGSTNQTMYVRSVNGALTCLNSTGTKEPASGGTLAMAGLVK